MSTETSSPEKLDAGTGADRSAAIQRVAHARRAMSTAKFGPVRAYFKSRPGAHWQLQRTLSQARIATTYDVYLTRSVTLAALAGGAGVLAGVLLTAVLAWTGSLTALSSPFAFSGRFVTLVSANRVPAVGAALSVSFGGFAAAAVWWTRYHLPSLRADSRRRQIDVMLPHAIVYMYALSYGGMDFMSVLSRMAEAEDTYGEVAKEFDMVVRDVEVFGNDLFTALRNARNLTPSENLETFFDDMLSVLDSGGNLTTFFRDESDKYMNRAQEDQKQFLETLALLSEVFVVAFVAAPLFLIITLVMMTLFGSSMLGSLIVLVYVVLPLGTIGFTLLISMLSEPYRPPNHDVRTDRRRPLPSPSVTDDPRYPAFEHVLARRRLRALVAEPTAVFRRNPVTSLVVTVPLALGAVAIALVLGGVPTPQTFIDAPVRTTVLFAIVPFFVVATPLTYFHERAQRRRRHVAGRLPDVLDILASANQMGVPLSEGLSLVARSTTGRFSEELRYVRDDVRWNHDVRRALLSLASRLAVPQLTRTCQILAEGSRSTGDLYRILRIAAEDTRHRYRLERARQQELNSYVAVVVIGFLVYLCTVVVIDRSFLAPVVERVGDSAGSMDGLAITVGAGTVSMYHVLFLHSALVMAVGTGLIIGELADNNAISGLKYSLGLVSIALCVFVVL